MGRGLVVCVFLGAVLGLGACISTPKQKKPGAGETDAGSDASLPAQGALLGGDAAVTRPPFGHLPDGSSCGPADVGGGSASGLDGAVDGFGGDGAGDAAVTHRAEDGGGGTPPGKPAVPAPAHPGDLVITELLADPKTLGDSAGEWFELYNASALTLDLFGCAVQDRSTGHPIMEHAQIAPGAYLAVARGTGAGFTPGVVATFSLTNSSGQIALVCNGITIDGVVFDRAQGFPLGSGASAALDPASLDATANDDPHAWCLATQSYGPELGTPGAANPPCFASDGGVP
jgi:hypothetical protein